MQYKYKTIVLSSDTLTDGHGLTRRLDEYGKEGWELVSSLMLQGLGSSPYNLIGITQKAMLIFKRPADKEAEE